MLSIEGEYKEYDTSIGQDPDVFGRRSRCAGLVKL